MKNEQVALIEANQIGRSSAGISSIVEIKEAPCQQELMASGGAFPKTCQRCGLSGACTGTVAVDPKFHYYAFAFAFGSSQASVYIGYDDMAVTLAKIQGAKKSAGVSGASVMLGCSYLGYMTRHEMTGGES